MRQSLIAAGMFLLTGGMVGCGTSSTQEKEDLIVVDVSKDYPKKELILQDLFDAMSFTKPNKHNSTPIFKRERWHRVVHFKIECVIKFHALS